MRGKKINQGSLDFRKQPKNREIFVIHFFDQSTHSSRICCILCVYVVFPTKTNCPYLCQNLLCVKF